MPTDDTPWRRRIAPVAALMVLAPWAAECSWGGFALADVPVVVIFLAPMYGGAAVLIRETARRTGGGWPAIVLLAAAFGVLQAGLVDQSLFNPDFLADTEFAESAATAKATWVPGLEFSAQQALDYVGNHIALSICAPIAIVESLLGPDRRRRAWLGRPGLLVVGVVYLLGSALIFSDTSEGFLVSPVQLGFVAVAVLGLVGAAWLPRWRRTRRPRPARAPHPIWVGLVAVVARAGSNLAPGWGWFAVSVGIIAVVATVVVGWSRRTGWGQRHVLAGWGAGLLAAAAGAYLIPNYAPASPAEALVGDVAVSVVALALVGGAWWRLRRLAPPSPDGRLTPGGGGPDAPPARAPGST
jgi:hypothetical protein